MQLNRHGREFYELQITTTATDGDPIPASGWEASFDRGTTWTSAVALTHDAEDWSAWLVAGDAADGAGAVAVLDRSVSPLVRAIDNPEIVVRQAPRITVM